MSVDPYSETPSIVCASTFTIGAYLLAENNRPCFVNVRIHGYIMYRQVLESIFFYAFFFNSLKGPPLTAKKSTWHCHCFQSQQLQRKFQLLCSVLHQLWRTFCLWGIYSSPDLHSWVEAWLLSERPTRDSNIILGQLSNEFLPFCPLVPSSCYVSSLSSFQDILLHPGFLTAPYLMIGGTEEAGGM